VNQGPGRTGVHNNTHPIDSYRRFSDIGGKDNSPAESLGKRQILFLRIQLTV
jgi:hypothetical protein